MQNNLSNQKHNENTQQNENETENQPQKTLNPKYNKNYTKQQISLVFSYLNGSTYYHDLKKVNTFVCWMSLDQKRQLLNSSFFYLAKKEIAQQAKQICKQVIEKRQNEEIKIVVIILHGKLFVGRDSFHSGEWVILQEKQLDRIYEEKSVCLIFSKSIFERKIVALNYFHYIKNRFKTFFLNKAGIFLHSTKMDEIVEQLQCTKNTQKFTLLNSEQKMHQKGIYILNCGNFNVIDMKTNIKVGQISQNYFGEQSLWTDFKYNLQSKQIDSEFIFCSQQILESTLDPLEYFDVIGKLKQLYQQRILTRQIVSQQIGRLNQEAQISKERLKNKIKLKIDEKQLNQTLANLKKNKPDWEIKQQENQKNLKSGRKSTLKLSSQSKGPRKKYFSVKITRNETISENKAIVKNHFSQEILKRPVIDEKHLYKETQKKQEIQVFDTYSSTINNFSKYTKTTFTTKQKLASTVHQFRTPIKSKSEQKITKTNADDFEKKIYHWDVEYSKKYDRVLSASIRKQKHLNLVFQLKNKIFPKEKGQFFTVKDSTEAIKYTFYELEMLRRKQTGQKNKRSFQKIFKQKMLLATSMHPNTTR